MMEKVQQRSQEFRLREEGILKVALELLLEYGDEKVTVELIAEKVGIGKGTIYKHFHSKAEIYLRLMVDYERMLSARLNESIEDINAGGSDKGIVARSYLSFRIQHHEKDHLFQRLEEKLVAQGAAPELVAELHSIRNSNLDDLAAIIKISIGENVLENVPPSFHYLAAWALAQGAVAMNHSKFFEDRIGDLDAVMQFILDIGIKMGNRGQAGSNIQSVD